MELLMTTSPDTWYRKTYTPDVFKNHKHIPSVLTNAHAESMMRSIPCPLQKYDKMYEHFLKSHWSFDEVCCLSNAMLFSPFFSRKIIYGRQLLKAYQTITLHHSFQCIFNICLLFQYFLTMFKIMLTLILFICH